MPTDSEKVAFAIGTLFGHWLSQHQTGWTLEGQKFRMRELHLAQVDARLNVVDRPDGRVVGCEFRRDGRLVGSCEEAITGPVPDVVERLWDKIEAVLTGELKPDDAR